MIKNKELTQGWIQTSLGEITYINPNWLDFTVDDEEYVSFVPMASVEEVTGCLDATQLRQWKEVKSGYSRFQENDVVVAKITPSMENGKGAIARNLHNNVAVGSTEFHILRPTKNINSKLLLHFLLRKSFRKRAQASMKGGVGHLRVPSEFLIEAKFLLPPIAEQERIVREIEKQFSRLEIATKSLQSTESDLKKLRASIRKRACQGKLILTEAALAHKENREYESASILLKTGLVKRQEDWESAQLHNTKATKKNLAKNKYKPPLGPPVGYKRPDPPVGWVWAGFEQLASFKKNAIKAGPFGSELKKAFYTETGYKVYGQEQVIKGDPFYGNYFIDEKLYKKLNSCAVKPGDILISLVGTTGKILVLPKGIQPGIINPRLLKLSLNPELVDVQYIKCYLESPIAQNYFQSSLHGGTMGILNLSILKGLPVLLPPLLEQKRIVEEVEKQLKRIDIVEDIVQTNLQNTRDLHQSILECAFEGRLVSQNLQDESASVLFERIVQEKLHKYQEVMHKKETKKAHKSAEHQSFQIKETSENLIKFFTKKANKLSTEELFKEANYSFKVLEGNGQYNEVYKFFENISKLIDANDLSFEREDDQFYLEKFAK